MRSISFSSNFMARSHTEFVVADGSAPEIRGLLHGMELPYMTLAGCNDPLQVITTALAGEVVETLHVVAHGRAGGFQLGGQWVDECALQGAAPLLAQWNVRNIALWSCDVGQDRAFLDALARLTGAEVHASTRALGKVHGQARWALDVPGETPVALPFQAAVAEAWPHQLVSLNFTNAYAVNTATTPAGKESNSLDFVPTSLNVARIDDKTGNQNFSGNDVVVELVVVLMVERVVELVVEAALSVRRAGCRPHDPREDHATGAPARKRAAGEVSRR